MPRGVAAQVVATDGGFGFGEQVTVVASDRLSPAAWGIPIVVAVLAPATTSLPIGLEVGPGGAAPLATAGGTTNAWAAVVAFV